ncbi:hypothetical protein BKA64DRAFT_375481 [Cadophora sp. MPI-SDFR-AT-0126]|nr:hypothetical protein BKA64DRAFT_375481 [Leotiomycetes sp. MPI-SDFR-AT-0126]
MVGFGGRVHVKRCHQCRKRKFKCDGGVPACQRCTGSGRICPGYEQKLEFVFFESDPRTKSGSRKKSLSSSSIKQQLPEPRIGQDHFDVLKDRAASVRNSRGLQVPNPVLDQSLSAPQKKMGFYDDTS